MAELYKIDASVPIPPKYNEEVIPLSSMKIGESILLPLAARSHVQVRASRLKSTKGLEFTTRTMGDGTVRVWRVK